MAKYTPFGGCVVGDVIKKIANAPKKPLSKSAKEAKKPKKANKPLNPVSIDKIILRWVR